ncbi:MULTISPECIES: IS66-like element accessory protein TnpA [Hydrogenophaga]|uniref:IS66-like element accessory protein TnpA n=1 Tax=Hydrogenophaga TaxID=47420 RepID=UPI001314A413|nr:MULTISPECIES: transposase [Hydrogenophaga]
MNTIPDQQAGPRQRRRVHSDAFKAGAVTACAQPGMSMAAVAMAHGINANLLRRWVHEAEMKPRGDVVRADVVVGAAAREPKTVFVPVSLPPSTPPAQVPDIRIELRRGPTTVTVTWPAGAASDCAVWMRELLR